MTLWRYLETTVGGRRLVSGLGGVFVVLVATYPFLPFVADEAMTVWPVLGILAGVPGLVLVYGGYRLPRTDIHPEFYGTVAKWCLRGVAAGAAIMILIVLAGSDRNVFPNTLLLTALSSLGGFAAGSYDAGSKTRYRQLHETIDQLEAANERLERHQTYTDDILDAIDDVFYVVDEDGYLERWNQSLPAVTGYTNDEIAAMEATDFFDADDQDAAETAVRSAFKHGSVRVEIDLRTRDGEKHPFEFIASTVENPSGETVLAGIARDVSDRVEREQRLEELVEDLEESNKRLEQFAYAASHDLQEPLRMVSSYLQLLDQRYSDELDEDGREFIEFAVDGADRMRAMIEGLLKYSRIETQGEPIEEVDLEAVFSDVLDDLQMQIEESNAEIMTDPLPQVEGDADQLRQVFQNLLENAMEYSGEAPPQIHVAAERNGDEWVVSVSDEGVGIDAENPDRIFEVFQRLHSHDEHAGTGIGLAICRRIIERHGGEIWVESEPSEGTTFSFTLPAVSEAKV